MKIKLKKFIALATSTFCLITPLSANEMLDAVDQTFGISKKSYHYELERDKKHKSSTLTESIIPPTTSNKFKSYEVFTNPRYGNVCGIHAIFSDNSMKEFKSASNTFSRHFNSSGHTRTESDSLVQEAATDVVSTEWTDGFNHNTLDSVLLMRITTKIDGVLGRSNSLSLKFKDFDKCMSVDQKYDTEYTVLFEKSFKCDVVSHIFTNEHGVQFIDTAPPLPKHKDASTARLSFDTYRLNKTDTFSFDFEAEVTKQSYHTRRIRIGSNFFNTYWNPTTWAAKSGKVSFRSFPKIDKNGSLVAIGDTGFSYHSNNDNLSIFKSGNVLTGIAKERHNDESSITHFSCTIQENDWQNVLEAFYQDAKRYTFNENGKVTEGFDN